MEDRAAPVPAKKVLAAMKELFKLQGRSDMVRVLENARASFEQTNFDNWNGGTYTWGLRLEIPVHVYADSEPRRNQIEQEIGQKLEIWERQYSNDHFSEVVIVPDFADASPSDQPVVPPDDEVQHLWAVGRFRLFLSHISADRLAVSRLKGALRELGVDAFVAHEDIEPSKEWQHEIELALRTMHALAAVITPDFRKSNWTDQEVGWALGRGKVVVPIRLGSDPHGLMGKYQAVRGNLEEPEGLAWGIVTTLLSNPKSSDQMRPAVFNAFTTASSSKMAKSLHRVLLAVRNVTPEETESMWKACADNPHVAEADGVRAALYATFGEPPELAGMLDSDVPF